MGSRLSIFNILKEFSWLSVESVKLRRSHAPLRSWVQARKQIDSRRSDRRPLFAERKSGARIYGLA